MTPGWTDARSSLLCACLVVLACPVQAEDQPTAPAPVFDVHVLLGGKYLNSSDWGSTDNQFEYGGEFDFQPASWPVALNVGYYRGQDLGVFNFKSTTQEFQLGVKKFWPTGQLGRVFVGGGLTVAKGTAEAPSDSNAINGHTSYQPGGWVSGGYLFSLGRHFDLGVDLKYSYAEASLKGSGGNSGQDIDVGGLHVAGVFGYRWQ